MKTSNKEFQNSIKPSEVAKNLMLGNKRFTDNERAPRDLLDQVNETSQGQYPVAAILSCIDSRVPVEMVFDQGIGDIFSIRIAGNTVNDDILGSLEYACKVAGAKLILVLGHTKCGAVTSACNEVELGNITQLLHKIKPAVNAVYSDTSQVTESFVKKVTIQNVHLSIDQIRAESPIISELEQKGQIAILGGLYNVEDGKVEFFQYRFSNN
jgi:carbonic anhydrase